MVEALRLIFEYHELTREIKHLESQLRKIDPYKSENTLSRCVDIEWEIRNKYKKLRTNY